MVGRSVGLCALLINYLGGVRVGSVEATSWVGGLAVVLRKDSKQASKMINPSSTHCGDEGEVRMLWCM